MSTPRSISAAAADPCPEAEYIRWWGYSGKTPLMDPWCDAMIYHFVGRHMRNEPYMHKGALLDSLRAARMLALLKEGVVASVEEAAELTTPGRESGAGDAHTPDGVAAYAAQRGGARSDQAGEVS